MERGIVAAIENEEDPHVQDGIEYTKPVMLSKYQNLKPLDDTISLINNATTKISNSVDSFIRHGWNWRFSGVDHAFLNVVNYEPLKGGNYISSPKWLVDKKAVVNVQNDDNKCFRWAVKSGLFPQVRNANRTCVYPNDEEDGWF